jgi:hypothetical protein
MARIRNLHKLNEDKIKVLNINLDDKQLMISRDELVDIIRVIMDEELSDFSSDLLNSIKSKLITEINLKTDILEKALLKHFSDKINKVSEEFVIKSLTRNIENELNIRTQKR